MGAAAIIPRIASKHYFSAKEANDKTGTHVKLTEAY
jgi:hypothetical protein